MVYTTILLALARSRIHQNSLCRYMCTNRCAFFFFIFVLTRARRPGRALRSLAHRANLRGTPRRGGAGARPWRTSLRSGPCPGFLPVPTYTF